MSIKDAILATICAEERGEVRGRTLLQKKLYFVSVLTGEDFGYSPLYYGPYSSMVSDDLGVLVEAGFVQEEIDVFSEALVLQRDFAFEGRFRPIRRVLDRDFQPASGLSTRRERRDIGLDSASRRGCRGHKLAARSDLTLQY